MMILGKATSFFCTLPVRGFNDPNRDGQRQGLPKLFTLCAANVSLHAKLAVWVTKGYD